MSLETKINNLNSRNKEEKKLTKSKETELATAKAELKAKCEEIDVLKSSSENVNKKSDTEHGANT